MNKILLTLSSLYLAVLVVCALFPQILTPFAANQQLAEAFLASPSWSHWFGTDELGRDLLSRVLFGARISLASALLATLVSTIFGVLYGSVSGYAGGTVDQLMMRVLDVLYAIPDLLVYILLGLYLGQNFTGILIALSAFGWVTMARLTRGEVLKYKEMAFVEAGQALGIGSFTILGRHILPQIREPLLAALLLKIPTIILAESTLSFIGLGLAPPHASWGTLASEGVGALQFYPHLILFPSLFIFLTIFSFQTLGNHLSLKMQK